MMRELTYYVAVSIDGFIAGPGGEFDQFLFEGDHAADIARRYQGTAPTQLAERAGFPVDGGPFDTVLMGWNTYAVGLPDLPDPYQHLRQIVFTRGREAPAGSDGVEFTDRDPVEVVREVKAAEGRGIWLCGGGALAAVLRDEIDRLALKRNPVLFGAGIPLFEGRDYAPAAFRPTGITPYESGVVLAEYVRA
ncbi:dihydrofolate reductase family protein [Microbacterium sp. AK031]|uniref:dihydrofolate reductase family protein n=1 Tax=Microbacterium sp. AK031 TaxID=2723076 RepID=UPI0021687409|nr:dihydrofolate reductase family protein [Microbacterium sp. AK031]MCS3843292.1 dihydrofolate reductase [Microbacterium sp. AK031]